MKPYSFLLSITLALLLSSCAAYSPTVSFVDYSSFNADGTFLTESNSVNFSYEPIGSINVLLYSGFYTEPKAQTQKNKNEKVDGIYYSTTRASGRVKFKNATIDEAIKIAVEQAKIKNANAIINLRYEYVPALKNNPDGWHISGMAIKR